MIRLLIGLTLLAGCTSNEPRKTPLIVFAAASLIDSFADLERGFEAAYPQVDVRMVHAGSHTLRLQLEEGASADVFASANVSHAKALAQTKILQVPQSFAQNRLVIITPKENPAKIKSFDDLSKARRIVIGTDAVPVGRYTTQMLNKAEKQRGIPFAQAIRSHVVSRETNVRQVRAKVVLGEADAAIVYRTDGSNDLNMIPIPDALNVVTQLTIGRLQNAPQAALSAQFITYVQSSAGQKILAAHGFTHP